MSSGIPFSQLDILIRCLPLLEDLVLDGDEIFCCPSEWEEWMDIVYPSTPPALTGMLELHFPGGMTQTPHILRQLPGGIHFRTLNMWCHYGQGFHEAAELVVTCSETLEHLEIMREMDGTLDNASPFLQIRHPPEPFPTDVHPPGEINLSQATKLKEIVFRCEALGSGWVIRTLETITPKHRDFQRVSVCIASGFGYVTAEDCRAVELDIDDADPGMHWRDLNSLLVCLWESRSVRTTVVCPQHHTMNGGREMKDWTRYLLPEVMRRGNADITEEPSGIV